MIRDQLNKFMSLDEDCFKINSKINKCDIWAIIRYNLSEIILSENNYDTTSKLPGTIEWE